MRVVIVDDSLIAMEALRILVESDGHVVVAEAGDGKAAVDAAVRLRPDIVLIDAYLGDESGFDVCRALKSASPNLPVVLISMDEAVAEGELLASGANAFIPKDKLKVTPLDSLLVRD